MLISNVMFTGNEVRTVIERSGLPLEVQCQIWASFVDFATIDKRFGVIREDPNEGRDVGDEHPNLFV